MCLKLRELISDLLVDSEEFGSTCVLWDGCVHRVIAKHLQRASNVESLIDDLTRQRESLRRLDDKQHTLWCSLDPFETSVLVGILTQSVCT